MRFADVDEVKMEGFNHQNAILGLAIDIRPRGEKGRDLLPYIHVQFQPAFGLSASFRCFRIEVVDAVRCTEEGTGRVEG